MKRYTKGFTLIELLVVIAIIGILASVVLVSLQSARKKGNDTRVISSVQQIRTALESNFSGTTYPDLTSTTATNFGSARPSGNIDTLITDITTNQTSGGLSGTIGYGAVAAGTYTAGSVLITKDGVSPGKGYAIYAKLPSTGMAFCIDGTGNTKQSTTYPANFAGFDDTKGTNCQ